MAASPFLDALERRVLLFDGAMGTSIHKYPLDIETDYLGRENCTEALLLTRPDVIGEIHESFLAAGCDAVETDTFGGMPHVLEDNDLVDRCREINLAACKVAREACDKYATADRPRFVIGSMGPGTKLITLQQIDWQTMHASYLEQTRWLIEGGANALLIETSQDLLQIKVALDAILEGMDNAGVTPQQLPILVNVTIETTGTMLTGSHISAAAQALATYPITSLGMNCATGPEDMAEHIEFLARHWTKKIAVLPNAGLPSLVAGETVYPLGPKPFAETMGRYVQKYGLSIVGGCCGTTPEHLAELAKTLDGRAPVALEKQPQPAGCTSLYGAVDYRQDLSILNIGERCNSSGSRKFKQLLEAEDWDEIVSLARDQMREGSHVIDVNVDYAGRDNAADMAEVVSRLVRQVDAPLMLDSTNAQVIEAGLRQAGGKCLINSGNFEGGEEGFDRMCKLARRYGAGLVIGCIDEDPEESMARTEERKIEIATRAWKRATELHGFDAADIMIDPLVLPISTGMASDRRSGLETIEGVRRICRELPDVQTTVGLSNISFGLKPAARQVLNSVFLHELTQAGLHSAIVHVSKILPKTRIDAEQWDAAMELIYDRRPAEPVTLRNGEKTDDPLQIFIDLFSDDAAVQSTREQLADLPLEERLQKHIIDGEKKAIHETLDEAMRKYSPLQIINEHLLEGMKVVGELFGSGQMQLPFVLQSAEVMKMAVAHLEPHMEKVEGSGKGRIVLATVRGDVHDIGKNLVDIILSNNGFEVVNLGIKQPISDILKAFEEHNADAIGLSGLLVKSVNVMEENLGEMKERGMQVPVLLGGAALSRHYCDSHLRNVYGGQKTYHGRDAFEGLRIMNHLSEGKLDLLEVEIEQRLAKRAETDARVAASKAAKQAGGTAVAEPAARSSVATDVAVPEAPFRGSRVAGDIPLEAIWPYINRVALFRGQWGFKKGRMSDEDYKRQIEDTIEPIFERLTAHCAAEAILVPQVVYGYFDCNAEGDDLLIYDPNDPDRVAERFSFPRQGARQRLCISDFFKPVESGQRDLIGMHCVTVGQAVSGEAKKLFDANNYSEYLYMHGLGVEAAEGLAELWHKRMRQEMGIGVDDASEIRKLFTQHYRGSRFSFGYPACPDMSDQEKLFRLLEPERIGCKLTENWQIDPEQSTSAIVVHHPEAKYFSI